MTTIDYCVSSASSALSAPDRMYNLGRNAMRFQDDYHVPDSVLIDHMRKREQERRRVYERPHLEAPGPGGYFERPDPPQEETPDGGYVEIINL